MCYTCKMSSQQQSKGLKTIFTYELVCFASQTVYLFCVQTNYAYKACKAEHDKPVFFPIEAGTFGSRFVVEHAAKSLLNDDVGGENVWVLC
jgi:hypothetical protein